jgi:hypothetical protein
MRRRRATRRQNSSKKGDGWSIPTLLLRFLVPLTIIQCYLISKWRKKKLQESIKNCSGNGGYVLFSCQYETGHAARQVGTPVTTPLIRLWVFQHESVHARPVWTLSTPQTPACLCWRKMAHRGDVLLSTSISATTISNVIEWHHDSSGLALSSLSWDRHCAPWPDPTRQATGPMPRTTGVSHLLHIW